MMVGPGFLEGYFIFGYLWFLGGFLCIAIMGIKNAKDLLSNKNKK